ncbi:flagellar basal-body MS-ring/collar protein FliF [Solimonas terrae]|uniref:Flagellar M-ring protein n=1 Tax=Solimonas terrae TaxID=1396819 RepID=A0A6M2BYS2_9GAMM|nr:flagellar basal-body MS-ring/collar protein FliF [Solimonas terrae]NGY06917.1 flagellar basal body M-ring protein FliF [Solimonas terrae]
MASVSLPAVRQLKDVPALRQLAVLAGIAAAVAVGLLIWSWSQKPGYVPVYSDLSDKDAAELADALRAADIPMRLDGGTVTVPQAQLYDARLKLAAQGLPHGASQGFESMQQDQGFGTSQFVENARYQHAQETELARTIGSLQPVRGARVHLAIPKPSAFASRDEAPSASVFVELYSGRTLEADQVASIVHLVASSVPGLLPAAVTVIDQFGHLLTNDADSALARTAEQFDYTRRVESDFQRRIEQLLTPMLGAGRVSAQVAADLDFAETEEAREQYGPDPAKVRSEQISEDTQRGARTAAGVPGATSNEPPSQSNNPKLNQLAGPDSGSDVQSQSKQESRTYELDRTLSHTRQSVGRLKRLSVAVLVDHIPKTEGEGKDQKTTLVALTPEQLGKVEALVKEAVGFDASRGDTVSVQNSAFVQPDVPTIEALPVWQQPQVLSIARQTGGVLLVLALILFILRPALRQLLATPTAMPALEGTVEGGAQAAATKPLVDDRLSLQAVATPSPYDQKLQLARKAVGDDPKRVAQVVKSWIGAEGG